MTICHFLASDLTPELALHVSDVYMICISTCIYIYIYVIYSDNSSDIRSDFFFSILFDIFPLNCMLQSLNFSNEGTEGNQ